MVNPDATQNPSLKITVHDSEEHIVLYVANLSDEQWRLVNTINHAAAARYGSNGDFIEVEKHMPTTAFFWQKMEFPDADGA